MTKEIHFTVIQRSFDMLYEDEYLFAIGFHAQAVKLPF